MDDIIKELEDIILILEAKAITNKNYKLFEEINRLKNIKLTLDNYI